MDKKVIEFCSGCSKCPVLEVAGNQIELVDYDQSAPGRVSLSREQAEDLLKGLTEALKKE